MIEDVVRRQKYSVFCQSITCSALLITCKLALTLMSNHAQKDYFFSSVFRACQANSNNRDQRFWTCLGVHFSVFAIA